MGIIYGIFAVAGTGGTIFLALLFYARLSVATGDEAPQSDSWVAKLAAIRTHTVGFGQSMYDHDKPSDWGSAAFGMIIAALWATMGWIHILR